MKKVLPKLFPIILIVAIILGGKKYIDYKTFDYTETVNEGINNYFINGDSNELAAITELLDTYANDEEVRKEIQDYSLDVVVSWIAYLDNKYFCDNKNLNSCIAQLDEFNVLVNRLTVLYETKGEEGYTIILPSSYSYYKGQVDEKIVALQKLVKSPASSSPHDSERIRITKCATASECSNCHDNLCECIYIDEDRNRENVTCFVLSN